MELKSIFVNIRPFEKDKANNVLKVLKLTLSDIQIEDIRFREIVNKIILSFMYNPKYSKSIVEKFILNDFQILSPDEEIQKIIASIKETNPKKFSDHSDPFEGLPDDKITAPKIKSIEVLVKKGDYNGLLNIQHEVRLDSILRAEAEQKLDMAISNAIQIYYNDGLDSRSKIAVNVSKLMAIASNTELGYMKKDQLINVAVSYAIKLSATYNEGLFKLVDIYNNLDIDKELALRAILTLAGKVTVDKESYSDAINYAIQRSNIGNLRNILEQFKVKLGSNDLMVFNQLLNIITKRNLV